ncbi:hypothetical protein K227x_41310 [Rubripirellula lacrimiformis]|uniref:DUF2271 domain-containing protein n=1 Tax=Rubripirellula lacrimiformis TaxID=1930273 RepID=A0A517NFA1_9BACT|nr:DUF2271 domain-containing protein [Rubripirellula lacrimiformis]QDT05728.1 hypothetical protein K227x_41310 [Rubripirellula lacrimiformis]
MKHIFLTLLLVIGVGTVGAGQPDAAKLEVSLEIPRLSVSEYHRPYIAVWIQDKDRNVVANLAAWYQLTGSREGEGTKWLPDLRQWWRRSGRSLELPVDGVSGATRPVGKHVLKFADDDKRLTQLKPGKYELYVEAAREVGGRELVHIEFTWPTEQPFFETATGDSELGEVSLAIRK